MFSTTQEATWFHLMKSKTCWVASSRPNANRLLALTRLSSSLVASIVEYASPDSSLFSHLLVVAHRYTTDSNPPTFQKPELSYVGLPRQTSARRLRLKDTAHAYDEPRRLLPRTLHLVTWKIYSCI
jgi:hypothetical protein